MDSKLALLERAHHAWKVSMVADFKTRLELAHEMNDTRQFSIRQVAKIVRVTPATLSKYLDKKGDGGRFNPESLSALMSIRRIVSKGEKAPAGLVRSVVNDGTSGSTLAKLVGLHHSRIYEMLRED